MRKIISFILILLLVVNTVYAELPTEYDEYYINKNKEKIIENKEKFKKFLIDKTANNAEKSCACFNLGHHMEIISTEYICDIEGTKSHFYSSSPKFVLTVEKRSFPLPFLKNNYYVCTYDHWVGDDKVENIKKGLYLDINQTYVCPVDFSTHAHYDIMRCNTCFGEIRKILFIPSEYDIFFYKGMPKQNLTIFPNSDDCEIIMNEKYVK